LLTPENSASLFASSAIVYQDPTTAKTSASNSFAVDDTSISSNRCTSQARIEPLLDKFSKQPPGIDLVQALTPVIPSPGSPPSFHLSRHPLEKNAFPSIPSPSLSQRTPRFAVQDAFDVEEASPISHEALTDILAGDARLGLVGHLIPISSLDRHLWYSHGRARYDVNALQYLHLRAGPDHEFHEIGQ
jgi:hypothetical protein